MKKPMQVLTKILIMLIVMKFLTACSSMNSGFDCPNKAGVMCKSIDQINTIVDSGNITGRSLDPVKKTIKPDEFQSYQTTDVYHAGDPLRYGETVQRIWIAPYEDTENNYHQDNLMYVIIKNGHWIGMPVTKRHPAIY